MNDRVKAARFVGLLLTSCPFGVDNVKDNEHDIAVKDVVELINELL